MLLLRSCAFTLTTDVFTGTFFSWALRTLGNGFSHMIVADLARLEPYIIEHLGRLDVALPSPEVAALKPEDADGK